MKNILSKKQKQNLLKRLVPVISCKINKLKEEWTLQEIAERCELLAPRLSDLLRKNSITEKTLQRLMMGGFLKIDDLFEKEDLTAQEKEYLKKFVLLEDSKARNLLIEIKEMGFNVVELLENFIVKEKSKKIISL